MVTNESKPFRRLADFLLLAKTMRRAWSETKARMREISHLVMAGTPATDSYPLFRFPPPTTSHPSQLRSLLSGQSWGRNPPSDEDSDEIIRLTTR
jgi:hypothetical protein